jgi:hypothetical protein
MSGQMQQLDAATRPQIKGPAHRVAHRDATQRRRGATKPQNVIGGQRAGTPEVSDHPGRCAADLKRLDPQQRDRTVALDGHQPRSDQVIKVQISGAHLPNRHGVAKVQHHDEQGLRIGTAGHGTSGRFEAIPHDGCRG